MIGEQVGNYRITARLGEGGMGVVYLAEHPLIGKKAAIKMLLPEYSAKPDLLDRFFTEARATSQLKHPGIIEVFDFGTHASGCAFIAMEFLDGESLAARIAREQRLSVGMTLEVSRQIAAALAAVHQQGIVHRDLKPDNVFLVTAPDLPCGFRAKVLDFGIAKLSSGARNKKTQTGSVMGTPAYMAPEQCRGAVLAESRSDIYSLGCMMFEMVTGRVPFSGAGWGDVMVKHIIEPAPSLDGETDPQLAQVIRRTLAKEPEHRQPSMMELAADLEHIATQRPSTGPYLTRPVFRGQDPTFVGKPTTLGGAAAEKRRDSGVGAPRTKRGWQRVAATLCIAVVIGGGAVSAWRYRSGSSAATERSETAHDSKSTQASLPSSLPPVTKVQLSVQSEPAGAAVLRIGGGRVGQTPFVEEVMARPGEAGFIVRLDGYEDHHVALDTTADRVAVVKLIKKPTVVAAVVAAHPDKAKKKKKQQQQDQHQQQHGESDGKAGRWLDPYAQ